MSIVSETKIYNLVLKSGIIKHKTRQLFIAELLKSLIKSRFVVFLELANKLDKPIKSLSIEGCIQDFFQKVQFAYEALILLLLRFVAYDKLVLSLDRTELKIEKLKPFLNKTQIKLYLSLSDF
jgi:hypothetical protein